MNNEKTWLTCREAAELLNYSQRHIINLIKKGKVSADRDDDGKYYIQKSEFYRVYPNTMRVEQDGNDQKSMSDSSNQLMEDKIKHLQEMVDEKKKQNDFLMEQLTNFTQEKSKMLEAINSHARLLEYKESKNEVAQSIPSKNKFGWTRIFGK